VWQAYLNGATQDAIAERFGISQARVSQILAEVRASIPDEAVDDLRKVEADRVAMLYAETMKILNSHHPLVSVQRGTVIRDDETGERLEDVGPKIAAINTALRIHERVAKTFGLDAPSKSEVRNVDAVDAEIERLVAQLGSRSEATASGPASG